MTEVTSIPTETVRTWEHNADEFGRIRGNNMSTAGRTWETNADEFGGIVNGTAMGWSLAVLVACSVEPGAGQTAGLKQGTQVPVTNGLATGKTSAKEFAKRAKVSDQTAMNYFNGWEKARIAGAEVPPAAELSPTDVGAFPLPAKPFNGPGGYVSTKNIGNGSAVVQVGNIIKGGKLTDEIAASPAALTALIEKASPKVIAAVMAEVSDKAFEDVNQAIVAVTTPAPPVLTGTGVKPAVTPSQSKLASVAKVATAVQTAKVEKSLADFAAKHPKPYIAPEDEIDADLPDGALPGMVAGPANNLAWLQFQLKMAEIGGLLNAAADIVADAKVPFSKLQLEAMAELIEEHVTVPLEALKAQVEFAH